MAVIVIAALLLSRQRRTQVRQPSAVPEAPNAETDADDFAYAAITRGIRRTVVGKVLFIFVMSVSLMLILELYLNQDVLEAKPRNWSKVRFATGLGATDAAVIVVGLLTVVAALSIALSGSDRRPGPESVKEFAASSVWAEQTAWMSTLSATAALTVALTQLTSASETRNSVLTAALLALSFIAVVLAGAVTTWKGLERETRVQSHREIQYLTGSLEALHERLRRKSPRQVIIDYVRFVVSLGFLPFLIELVILGVSVRFTDPGISWPGVRILQLPLVFALVIWGVVAVTVAHWKAKMELSRSDRWTAAYLRYGYILVLTLILFAAFSSASSPWGRAVLVVFWLGPVAFPTLLLWVAGRYGRGPAVFALHRQYALGFKSRVRLRTRAENA